MTAAIVYARISDDAHGMAEAVTQRQIPDCERYCTDHGLKVVEVITDNDLSASRYGRKKREGYLRALGMLKDGTAQTIVAWHLDRLYRQPRELEELVTLAESGKVEIRTLHGDYDLTNPDHVFMVRLLVGMAAKESDDKSRRLRRKHQQLADDGRPKGGGRGFGYAADMSIIEPEAEAIRAAVVRVLDGHSIRSVMHEWNIAGLLTPRGNKWSAGVVTKSLKRGELAGLREHHGEVVSEGRWKPILEREQWERLRAILNNPSRVTNGGVNARKWPYTGFVFCALCKGRLHVGVTNNKPAMMCRKDAKNCGRLQIVLDPLAELIREGAFERVLAGKISLTPSTVDHSAEVARLAELRGRLGELEDARYVTGDLSKASYERMRVALEVQMSEITAALSTIASRVATHNLPVTLEGLRKAWDSRGLAWQRALLALVYERIEIVPAEYKGQRFSTKRVVPSFVEAA